MASFLASKMRPMARLGGVSSGGDDDMDARPVDGAACKNIRWDLSKRGHQGKLDGWLLSNQPFHVVDDTGAMLDVGHVHPPEE